MKKYWIFLVGLLLVSCNEDKEFKSADRVAEPRPIPVVDPPSAEAIYESSQKPECAGDSNAATIVKLVSVNPSPLALPASPTFRFEVSVANCKNGEPVPLQGQVVYFDMDTVRSSESADIPYRSLDSKTGKELNKGNFSLIEKNEDLFGNSSPGLVYWKTQSYTLPGIQDKVILEVIPQDIIGPRLPGLGGFDVYLRVGDSLPAKQFIKLL